MQRDNNLVEVPQAASIRSVVEAQWRIIMSRIFDGLPYDESLRFTEEILRDRENSINAGTLDPKYDWSYDLYVAKFHHQWNLDHRNYNEETRERFRRYWENIIDQNQTILKEIGLNGLKTILLIHGAVAVGSLNIVAQAKTENTQLIIAAKLGLAFSLMGIILVGIGQLIMFVNMSEINGKLSSKLATKIKWNKLRAFSRYFRRHTKFLRVANYTIYGSVLWFCVYCVILYIVLVS